MTEHRVAGLAKPRGHGARRGLLGTAGGAEADPGAGRKHFAALDGVRGLAIILVMAYHYMVLMPFTIHSAALGAAVVVCSKGWCGVDLFFVLSGFLITGILYDSRENPRYFRNFYARRTLRIFPLYYAVLLSVAALLFLAWLLVPRLWLAQPKLGELAAVQPWLWTYTTNIAVAKGIPVPLVAHFWSLAVEEQFYLVWPLVMFALPKRAMAPVALSLATAALFIRLGLTYAGWSDGAIYVLTPCRMDSLAAGALAAILMRDPRFGLKRLVGPAVFLAGTCGAVLATA